MKRIVVNFILVLIFTLTSAAQVRPELKEFNERKIEKINPSQLVPARNKKGLWGYVDSSDHFVIKPVFTEARDFLNGYAFVAYGQGDQKKWTILSPYNTYYTDEDFDRLPVFDMEGYAIVHQHGNAGLMNIDAPQQLVLDCIYDEASTIGKQIVFKSKGSGEAVIFSETASSYLQKSKSGLNDNLIVKDFPGFGVLDVNNVEFLIPPDYDEIKLVDNLYYSICASKLYGAAALNGFIVIPPVFASPVHLTDEFTRFTINGEDRFISINSNLSVREYDDYLFDKLTPVSYITDTNLYDEEKNHKYKAAEMVLGTEDLYKVINSPCVKELIDKLVLVPVKVNSKYGFGDKRGRMVYPVQWDYAGNFDNGYAPVGIDGKFGFIDKYANQIIAPEYDWIEDKLDEFNLFAKDGYWYIVSNYGSEVNRLERIPEFNFQNGTRTEDKLNAAYPIAAMFAEAMAYGSQMEMIHCRATRSLKELMVNNSDAAMHCMGDSYYAGSIVSDSRVFCSDGSIETRNYDITDFTIADDIRSIDISYSFMLCEIDTDTGYVYSSEKRREKCRVILSLEDGKYCIDNIIYFDGDNDYTSLRNKIYEFAKNYDEYKKTVYSD